MPAINSANINVMIKAAEVAAQGIRRDFGEVTNLQVSRKGTLDFVTQTDLRAEKAIHKELEKARPKYGFLLEEGGEIIGKDPNYRWVVDPLDGTTNFIHAIPYICTSIALEKKQNNGSWRPVSAVILDPVQNDLFIAEEGKGAYLNDRRLQVSARHQFDEALLVTHSPKNDRPTYRQSMEFFLKITEYSKGMRTMGATALDLANIAAAKFDAGWYTSYKRWDIAAGLLMVREAGAVITQLDGDDNMEDPASLLIGNEKLHKSLLSISKPRWSGKAA